MTEKEKKIVAFNPSGIGLANANLFGLPFNTHEADTIILEVPWEVTVSYGGGAAQGPEAVREASLQVDLFDSDLDEAWKFGIASDHSLLHLKDTSSKWKSAAKNIIYEQAQGKQPAAKDVAYINEACAQMVAQVEERCLYWLGLGKTLGLLGGDHSTPLGMMQALAHQYPAYAVLQIDAHCDLRKAYEGFIYSHASIMFNALERIPAITQLVQVGIRDYCQEEIDYIHQSHGRVHTWFDQQLQELHFNGVNWHTQVQQIIEPLPPWVYVSFDIDGLKPELCPHTGTPVPGGLEFAQAVYLIRSLVRSGRTIIGFDLNEIAPGVESDWDANVGARLLYKICNLARLSQMM